ncbi:DUF3164 family protein [Methylogaea oryzae]|nr:DUF3164 family protein [Methylogaea oryzae]
MSFLDNIASAIRQAFQKREEQKTAQADAEAPADVVRREDAMGRLVPEHMIDPIVLARTDMVLAVRDEWMDMQERMRQFKTRLAAAIEEFVAVSAAEFEVKMGGEIGNVTFTTFDGKYKLKRKCHKLMQFNERLQVAMQLIEDYLESLEGQEELKILVRDKFMRDEAGNVSVSEVMSLRRYRFDDERWRKAMDCIATSIVTSGTIDYLNLYERGADKVYRNIPLDFSAL